MRRSDLDPWAEALDTFPLTGEPAARLAAVVRFAVLAPSSHNSQPWLFRVEGDRLELWADRTRALAVSDPEDRELTISCGCALLNLKIALRSFGQKISSQLLPDAAQPDLLARVRLEGDQEAGPDDRELYHAIPKRRTNRQPFESRGVPEGMLARARKAAEVEGAWLQTLDGESDRI
ncbi:MAG: nitroreductase, partial [Gemmatimonadales bacterium]